MPVTTIPAPQETFAAATAPHMGWPLTMFVTT